MIFFYFFSLTWILLLGRVGVVAVQGLSSVRSVILGLYCRRKCMKEDKFRHEIECKFAMKVHECGHCHRKTSTTKQCSGCSVEWYCDKDCQMKDWRKHKTKCLDVQDDIVQLSQFPDDKAQLARVDSVPKYVGVYYWGNSPAVDLLKLQQNEWSGGDYSDKLSLLLAGVGDLRNVIKTVASLPKEFKGRIEFNLNDCDAHVLAKNVLFLYMMFTADDVNYTSDTLVQLWYSLCITEEHNQSLANALKELMKIDEKMLAKMTSDKLNISVNNLKELKTVWAAWLTSSERGGPESHIRDQFQAMKTIYPDTESAWSIYIGGVPERHRESLQEWWETGMMLSSADRKVNQTVCQNVTLLIKNPLHDKSLMMQLSDNSQTRFIAQMFNQEPLIYTIGSDISPFCGWDYLEASSHYGANCVAQMYSTYISSLMNSFICHLKAGHAFFRVLLGSCFQLQDKFELNKYDRITTSNLAAYYGLPAILDFFKPFLNSSNSNAVLITELMNWIDFLKTTDPNPIPKDYFMGPFQFQSAVAKDTGIPFSDFGFYVSTAAYKEYHDMVTPLVKYLRAVFLMHRIRKSGELPRRKDIPKFKDILEHDGLKLRDFRLELNRVMPHKWKINKRRVTQLNGYERNLEWTFSKVQHDDDKNK
ncbi:uncharacterized protein [Ptychodera flava]|uniref:uncharacterized protein n=1 Tax=Ptychodera flava TaxID=63121 RepID=UPI00396A5CFE